MDHYGYVQSVGHENGKLFGMTNTAQVTGTYDYKFWQH